MASTPTSNSRNLITTASSPRTWVLCREDDKAGNDRWHSWNYAIGIVASELPTGIAATWACRAPTCSHSNCVGKRRVATDEATAKSCGGANCGRLCFVRLRYNGMSGMPYVHLSLFGANVVWTLPGVKHTCNLPSSSWFERGAPIEITCLQRRQHAILRSNGFMLFCAATPTALPSSNTCCCHNMCVGNRNMITATASCPTLKATPTPTIEDIQQEMEGRAYGVWGSSRNLLEEMRQLTAR